MEHRLNRRRAIEIDAIVTRRGREPLLAYTRNISREGMYICLADASTPLGPGDAIEVRLPGSAVERAGESAFAVVVHSSTDGAGLYFARSEPFGRILDPAPA